MRAYWGKKVLCVGCFIFLLLSIEVYGQADIRTLEKKITETENKIELANLYNKLGNLYWQKSQLEEASETFQRALNINQELGNNNAVRIINGYLGLIHLEAENYREAIKYFNVSLSLNKAKNKKQELISDYYNLASAYQMLQDYSTSNLNAEKALAIALELDNLNMAKSSNLLLAENYDKLGDGKKSSEHYTNYNTLVKHLQNQQMEQLQTEKKHIESKISEKNKELESALDTLDEVLQTKLEIEREKEIVEARSLAQQREFELQEKMRRTQLLYAILVLFLLAALLFLFTIQSRSRKKANAELHKRNKEIEEQKEEIELQRDLADKQRKNLTSSIQYARRIQSAVIPRQTDILRYFSDSFISYHPKDIVSGDFYWFTEKDNLFIIAAADCTGHGVPGAFMSMLGVAYLNEIINKIAINIHINSLNADDILNQLREKVITSLHQSHAKGESKDGMDMALCIIDMDKKTLQFAGAYNPVLIIRKGEIIEFKGDKMPVSFHQRKDLPFTRHDFDLMDGDCIYMFSDGYVDQFGGEKKQKYLLKRFRELLLNIHLKPMMEQKSIVEQEYNDWRGELTQVDDVLVVGFRFGKSFDKEVVDWSAKTILIAEDTDMNYYLLVQVLKKTRVNIVRVKEGGEAINFVKNNDVDLILMDINMPGIDGYEATEEIKRFNSEIPIIIQTAIHKDAFEKAKSSGANEFVSKPIDLKTFMNIISKFL
jgi:CheY-like chemotaxis protein/serine phosphatase RsbU (regulator of sigma subunit)